jgi:hypothetical protein
LFLLPVQSTPTIASLMDGGSALLLHKLDLAIAKSLNPDEECTFRC